MDLLEYLRQLYNYHYWANNRLLAAVVGLSHEQFYESQGFSWDSVHGTLLHLLSAEWMWLERWQGRSPRAFLAAEDYPTVFEIQKKWSAQEQTMRAFLAIQTPESVAAEIAYTNTHGEGFQLPLWQMMAHVVNHGTHHRAELAEMLAVLEVVHPEDELSYYFLEKSGQR